MRKGLAIIEVLIFIFIVAILAILIMPAIQEVRYAAEIDDGEYIELIQLSNKNDNYKQLIKIAMKDNRISRKEYNEIKNETALSGKNKLIKEIQ